MEIITQSAQETQKLGEKIGRTLALDKLRPIVLCLYGELGSGKTTFLQGLAKGLGINKRITSPTFVFVKRYEIRETRDVKRITYHISRFYHVDLYRVEKLKEAKNLGLEEVFSDPKAVVAIEWAEKITCLPAGRKEILPKKRIDIFFNYVSENQRKIIIK